MPIVVAIIVVSAVAGLITRPPVARAIAVVLSLVANAVFVWSIADGKGDDPAWLLVVSVIGAAAAVGVAHLAGRVRSGAAA